jgi:hypothetical protein
MIKYIGWKKLPKMGEAVNRKTVLTDSGNVTGTGLGAGKMSPSSICLSIN